jgi:mono/diheme cytochrome c family protein
MQRMKLAFASIAVIALALPIFGFVGQEKETEKKEEISFEKEIVPIVKTNCIGCHNSDYKKGGTMFPDKMTEEDALKNPKLWRRSARKVKSGQMPPNNQGSMGDKDREKFVKWVEAKFPRPK